MVRREALHRGITRQRAAAPRPTGSVPKMHLRVKQKLMELVRNQPCFNILGSWVPFRRWKCTNVRIILPFTAGDRRSPKSMHRPKVVNLRPRGAAVPWKKRSDARRYLMDCLILPKWDNMRPGRNNKSFAPKISLTRKLTVWDWL